MEPENMESPTVESEFIVEEPNKTLDLLSLPSPRLNPWLNTWPRPGVDALSLFSMLEMFILGLVI